MLERTCAFYRQSYGYARAILFCRDWGVAFFGRLSGLPTLLHAERLCIYSPRATPARQSEKHCMYNGTRACKSHAAHLPRSGHPRATPDARSRRAGRG